MENEVSIFDSVYKVCQACGKRKTLRNFRINEKMKVAEGSSVLSIVSNVCKCCEAHPEMQIKANRIALLKEKMARFKANEHARFLEQQKRDYEKELQEMGITHYCPKTKI